MPRENGCSHERMICLYSVWASNIGGCPTPSITSSRALGTWLAIKQDGVVMVGGTGDCLTDHNEPHILSWYESEEKRRWTNRQLNKGESVHSLKVYLSVGSRGVLRRKTDEGLEHQVGCLNLLTYAVILWNRMYMDQVLRQLESEGYPVNREDLLHIWPTRCEHINVHGKYEFNFEAARQRTGLRELRQPGELNP